jgi:SAM-dependent methyltransferase
MERRGAGEVVAIDVLDPTEWDWPPATPAAVRARVSKRHEGGIGFELAQDALTSAVQRLPLSVHALDPAVHGQFDFIFLGSLLLHLRDPVGALDRVRRVCAGKLLLVETIEPTLTRVFPSRPVARLDGKDRPWWWQPNAAAVVRMAESAGFEIEGSPVRVRIPAGEGQVRPRLRHLRHRSGRESFSRVVLGDPHVAMIARPRAWADPSQEKNAVSE